MSSPAAWVADHLRAAIGSLGRLSRTRVASGMTAAVLGISLALPATFLLLLQNIESTTGDWDSGAQISLFIAGGVSEEEYRALATELEQRSQVQRTEVVTPKAALEEFQGISGMEGALELLDENPLPPLIVVVPSAELDAGALDTLTGELGQLEQVDQARLDLEWVQRLHAIMELIRRGVWLVAALLAITVVLVVGNTIRLAIENRREEIVITKLIGATNAFIRRPFLYEGAWYGLGGGLLAVSLVELGRALLYGPARALSELYGTGLLLHGLGASGTFWVLASGIGLGLLGSWLAVGRHLASIEPR
ncbi:MAG: ABC transporter permease [Ectothiorhodospiraceae bacterium]|nr:ABC transporter permease [Ectothiorhodospiraceae bacterium]